MTAFFKSENISARFLALLAAVAALFVVTWYISYSLLPEGILRGRTASAALAGDSAAPNVYLEFLRIFLLNMFMLLVIAAANRILVIHGFPLGYLPPIILSVLYAITLGTNSFTIPMAQPMAPSLEVLSRSGVYEITAYALIAVSTDTIGMYRFIRLFPPDSEPISPAPSLMDNIHWPGMVLAFIVLAAANLWEAYQILELSV